MKILIFIVAYNAEAHIEAVLRRIPREVWNHSKHSVEILIIDDQSGDRTTEASQRFKEIHDKYNLTVLSNPVNQGYGGNQKIGYWYAIKNGFDVVILLHGDGQYAPEMLPEFIQAFADPSVDAVFGSRMMGGKSALRGGMPLYKFVGNRILTTLQNRLLHKRLSEFHSGYRAYRVSALKAIPFIYNSPDFDFDTDIIIQLVDTQRKILEIPIPTYYGNEICHVNGVKYAFQILNSTVRSRLQRYAIVYHPKFDYAHDNDYYVLKLGQPSSHQWAVDYCKGKKAVLDIGCGPGWLGAEIRRNGSFVMGVDKFHQAVPGLDWFRQEDLDNPIFDFDGLPKQPDVVLCLDIIEHLKSPESFLLALRERLSLLPQAPPVVLTTPNIAFALTRLSLFIGQFNYGKRGILDLTHTRLFTFLSMQRMLVYLGYQIEHVQGIPPPLQSVFGSGRIGRFMSTVGDWLARAWRKLFAYQILIVARPHPTLDRLLRNAEEHADERQGVLRAG